MYFELNENENQLYQSLSYIAKSVLRVQFIAWNEYIYIHIRKYIFISEKN